MEEYDLTRLPVHGQQPGDVQDEEENSCSTKVYVSNEESALLAALRELRERAMKIRSQLETADSTDRDALKAELERLRHQRTDLDQRRQRAFTRKMVMLGHLPPSALDD